MAATVTSGFLKRAWIRDPDVPAGQPAHGHFNCECGRKVRAGFYGQGESVRCACGTLYSNTGWILEHGEQRCALHGYGFRQHQCAGCDPNLSRAGVKATV